MTQLIVICKYKTVLTSELHQARVDSRFHATMCGLHSTVMSVSSLKSFYGKLNVQDGE